MTQPTYLDGEPANLEGAALDALLDFEVGTEYEADSSPSLWVMPIEVRVNVEAMG